jgi:glycosyltransferase involved in cell wall biosynthesis
VKTYRLPKVLFLVQLPPPVHGSANISQQIVTSKRVTAAFQVMVLPLRFAHSMEDLGSLSISKILKAITLATRLVRTLLRFKPDVVYFTLSPKGYSFYRDACYALLLKLFNTKIVYHLHVKGIAASSTGGIKKLLMKFVFNDTDTVVLSHLLAQDLLKVAQPRLWIVNNGIASTLGDTYSKPVKSPGQKIQVLFLSNLLVAKGIFVLLESLSLLPQSVLADISVVIIGNEGDVRYEDIQEYLKKNSLEKTVVLPGPKFGEEKYEYLKTSDIFVHPTLNDAFPLVVLEAMECQLPVIATIEGALPEIIDDKVTGFLIPKGDPQALAIRLGELVQHHELRQRFGKKGREKFVFMFTAEVMENRLIEVLQTIANR